MNRKEIIANNEISELLTLSLNGYSQKVLIEGKRKDLPVVITLHGGPGNPIPFSVGCRGLFKEFTDKYIMVYWDQLGCGINNYLIDDTFNIESFVCMTEDLVSRIKEKFPRNKILVFSTSWGSILSARLLEKNPYAVDGVISCGQMIKNILLCDEVKNCLKNAHLSKKKMDRINSVTIENYTRKDMQLIFTSLNKYTDAYQNKSGTKPPMGIIIKGLLTSPDYKFKDFKAIMVNGYMKNNSLWNEILRLDLTQTLNNIEVPYIILQGDTDVVASTKIVEEFLEFSNNDNLKLHIVSNTGHYPSVAMMNKLMEALDEVVDLL